MPRNIEYSIHNKTRTENKRDIILTFEHNGNYTNINMKHYNKYSMPTYKHMVEPDGNVFVCREGYNYRSMPGVVATKCHKHNRPMGCKFNINMASNRIDFMNRTQQDLDHCRCYCMPASQYDYDKWCYNDCINNNRPLCNNAEIYNILIHKYT